MKKLFTLCTLLCVCLFANTAKADVIEVPIYENGETGDGVSYEGDFGTHYYSYTIPEYAGTLTIASEQSVDYLYTNSDCTDGEIEGVNLGGSPKSSVQYTGLTPGATYYSKFSFLMNSGSIIATYVADSDEGDEKTVTLTLISPTEEKLTDGVMETDSLREGFQIIVKPSEYVGNTYDENGNVTAYGYILHLQIGEGENNVTSNSDVDYDESQEAYVWTINYTQALYTGVEYPVIATLTNGHSSDVLASGTLFTLIGKSESNISSVTLVSSDPLANTNDDVAITVSEGVGMINLTFSAPVMIDEDESFISMGTETDPLSITSITATGDVNNGYSTTWTIGISESILETLEGNMTLSVYVTDQEGKLFDGIGYCTLTYYYTIDTSSINAINAVVSEGAEIYNLSGQRVGTMTKGINIVKYADGTTRKLIIKK